MNYRHSYHAGGFSDVFKHVLLTTIISLLKRKETPFCYIDTHAGIGYYDLFSDFAMKNKEYVNGIEKLIQCERPPPLIKQYLDCVHKINNQLTKSKFASLRYYPGSPLIARFLLRPHDKIIACELQPQEYQTLRTTFQGDKQVSIHHMDGFLGLKAFLPPHENRGLVLIDPSYENPDEFARISKSLGMVLKKWQQGIYAIWYPIKEKKQIERFHGVLRQNIKGAILITELNIYPDLPHHLNGCGMAIINPPWQLQESIHKTLPWLYQALKINKEGGHRTYLMA